MRRLLKIPKVSKFLTKQMKFTENPLSSRHSQHERLTLGEHQPRLQILQCKQRSTLAERLHQTLVHRDLTVRRLQRTNDGCEVLALFRIRLTVRRQQNDQFQHFAEVLQRTMNQRGHVGTLTRYLWHGDKVDELGVGLA